VLNSFGPRVSVNPRGSGRVTHARRQQNPRAGVIPGPGRRLANNSCGIPKDWQSLRANPTLGTLLSCEATVCRHDKAAFFNSVAQA
jgi:hypothetical protein